MVQEGLERSKTGKSEAQLEELRASRNRVMLSLLRSFSRPALQRARPWGALRTHAKPLGRSTFADFASAHPEQKQYKAKKDSLLSPTMLLVGIIPFFTFALGTWQVQRLQWKVNLIDEVREKMEREPITLPKRIKCGFHPYPTAAPRMLNLLSTRAVSPSFPNLRTARYC